MHDIEAAQYLALSMMTVFVGNYARLQVAHWGKENYDELMEKALDPVEFSKSSASRAAWASIWPSVIDMVGTPFNEGENVISPFRSSGLESYGPESIPTGRRVGSAGRLLSGGIQMGMNALGLQDGDYEFSQKNWRDVKALLPFNTMPVIGNGINAIGNALDLPKESKKR